MGLTSHDCVLGLPDVDTDAAQENADLSATFSVCIESQDVKFFRLWY